MTPGMYCPAAHTASAQLRLTPLSINLRDGSTELNIILEFCNQGVPGKSFEEQSLKLTLLFFYANLTKYSELRTSDTINYFHLI